MTAKAAPPSTNASEERLPRLSGSELLLKALGAAAQCRYDEALPDRVLVAFRSAAEQVEASPVSNDELARIVAKVIALSELFRHSYRFPRWHEDLLKGLPPQIQDAAIVHLEAFRDLDWYQLATIKHIGNQRSARFFEDKRSRKIETGKTAWASHWDTLASKVAGLPIAQPHAAETLLRSAAGTDGVTQLQPDTLNWPGRHALHLSSVDDLIAHAIVVTNCNQGDFAELVRTASFYVAPVPHLRACHSWRQGSDAYGTDTFLVVRVGEGEFLCVDKEGYG